MDYSYYFWFVFLMLSCASAAGKGLTSWLSFVMSYCEFVTLGHMWYLIVSIPDHCPLP